MQNGIPTPAGFRLKKGQEPGEGQQPKFPCVVKVSSGGSSIGVSIVQKEEDYQAALDDAFLYGDEVVVEEYIKGRELTCCVLDGKALPIVEIAPKEGFYDYKNKYQAGSTIEICPAPIGEESTRKIQKISERVFDALRLHKYARMDFMMDEAGNAYCLEANTLPGMTPTSLIPQEAAAVGISYDELCQKILAVIRGYSGKEAAGIVIDSRKVEPGDIFVAIRGERVDGHQFIREVFDKGAIAVVCEEEPEELPGPCIRVEDSLAALRQIAAFYREQMPIPIVGITGSVGKTSTKEFVASVLAQKYKTHKTQGNFNNEIGVPLTLLAMPEDTEAAVVEMGINHFGEMHRLSEMVKPDICVMTNIGQCHLEFLGSRDGILKAKSEIFDFMNPEGTVCVNGDDDKLMTIEEVHGKKPVHFGLSPENDIYADTIASRGLLGSTATIHTPDAAFDVQIPLPGAHMVLNALAATAVGLQLGLTTEQIAAGIAAVQAVSGRSRVVQAGDLVLIDDCYNANPVSTKAALDLLSLADGRKVAVLGDMFELGEKEREMHGQVGAYAAEQGIDCLYCAGSLSEEMYRAAKEAGISQAEHFADTDALLAALPGLLHPGDSVLIKASHGMGYAKIVEALEK